MDGGRKYGESEIESEIEAETEKPLPSS